MEDHQPLCLCPAAYSGAVCQTNRCLGVTCGNAGTCENGICVCQPGESRVYVYFFRVSDNLYRNLTLSAYSSLTVRGNDIFAIYPTVNFVNRDKFSKIKSVQYVSKFCYDNEECEYPILFKFMSVSFVTTAIALYCTNWMGMALCISLPYCTRPENTQRKYPQSPKMDATRKKEARTTKHNMAKDSNGRTTKYGAIVGRGSGCS